jgi:hypothetical protein
MNYPADLTALLTKFEAVSWIEPVISLTRAEAITQEETELEKVGRVKMAADPTAVA